MRKSVNSRSMLLSLVFVGVLLMTALWAQQALAVPDLNLPSPVDMVVTINGSVSMWDITLSGFPLGIYDIEEGTYPGWCVDKHVPIDYRGGTVYRVNLYSTYDSGIPYSPNPDKGNWNTINFIINQKQYPGGAIQYAIWYFMNDLPYDDKYIVLSGAQPLIDDAQDPANNALSFEPGAGQVMAVLCDPGPRIQPTIFEVPRPVPEASTLLLFGSGLSGLLFFMKKKRILRF